VAKAETRARVVAHLKQVHAAPTFDAVQAGAALTRQEGLAEDPEIKALVDALPALHRDAIQFSANLAAMSTAAPAGDRPTSLAVGPLAGPPQTPAAGARPRPVLALVRGVLYAFDPATGSLRWARRVGVDAAGSPVWLPASPVTPETVLIATS